LNAEGLQGFYAPRHEALAAGFVDGKGLAIKNEHFHSCQPGMNGSGQADGAAPHNQNLH
jgi:hypothetical protein